MNTVKNQKENALDEYADPVTQEERVMSEYHQDGRAGKDIEDVQTGVDDKDSAEPQSLLDDQMFFRRSIIESFCPDDPEQGDTEIDRSPDDHLQPDTLEKRPRREAHSYAQENRRTAPDNQTLRDQPGCVCDINHPVKIDQSGDTANSRGIGRDGISMVAYRPGTDRDSKENRNDRKTDDS